MATLQINIFKDGQIIFEDTLNLSGNYLFGRSRDRCSQYLELFANPTEIIDFPDSSLFLSNFHATLLKCDTSYQIIDGWGTYYSRNGVFINSQKIKIKTLTTGDIIYLGCKDIELRYYENVSEHEIEKQTCQGVFEIRTSNSVASDYIDFCHSADGDRARYFSSQDAVFGVEDFS